MRGVILAIRTIREDGDPLLRKKSKEVENINDRLKLLISDMYETMYDSKGVGLAAPQVGILKRVIVIDDYEENKLAMINPVIIESTGEEVALEGCLSVPSKQGNVKRSTFVKVEYLDETGEKKSLEAKDFFARIIQHELDHLDGILYIDKADEVFVIENGEDEDI